jgi:ATP-dependent DNA helicase RecQ
MTTLSRPEPERVEAMAAKLGLEALDELDRAALRVLVAGEDAWVTDHDGARARARFFAAASCSNRPALLIGPSLATLARERVLLLRAGVPVTLLQLAGDRVAPAELAKLAKPGPLVVLVTSDLLRAPEVERALEGAGVAQVAIDGAHLLSPESHELRPSFASIAPLLTRLGKPKLHVLARRVPAEVRRQACEQLGLSKPTLLEASLLKEGVFIDTLPVRGERRNAALLSVLKNLTGPGVVLCATPHDVDAAFAIVDAAGIPACRAHSGMPKADSDAALARFSAGAQGSVLLTTSAHAPDSGLAHLGERAEDEPRAGFGTAAPRKDLRFVVHHQAPASLEQLASDVAWLSRDGQGGVALLLFDSAQLSWNDAVLEQQRLRGKHVALLLRALEGGARDAQAAKPLATPAKPLTVESLALQSGLSRRTTERLVLLFVDSGVLRRTPEGIRILVDLATLASASEALAGQLENLRALDRPRLAAVERLAEGSECRNRAFSRYFGGEARDPCGQCVACQRSGRPRTRAPSEQAAPRVR